MWRIQVRGIIITYICEYPWRVSCEDWLLWKCLAMSKMVSIKKHFNADGLESKYEIIHASEKVHGWPLNLGPIDHQCSWLGSTSKSPRLEWTPTLWLLQSHNTIHVVSTILSTRPTVSTTAWFPSPSWMARTTLVEVANSATHQYQLRHQRYYWEQWRTSWKLIASFLPVGGNRTHFALPKDLVTTIALHHWAIEVIIEFDKYFASRLVQSYRCKNVLWYRDVGLIPAGKDWDHNIRHWKCRGPVVNVKDWFEYGRGSM